MKRHHDTNSLPQGPQEFPWYEVLPEHREVIVRDFLDVFSRRAFSLTCSREFLTWTPRSRIWKRDDFTPTPIQMLHALGRWAPWEYIVTYIGLLYLVPGFNNDIFNLYAGMIREGRDALALRCLERGDDEYPSNETNQEKQYEYQHLGVAFLSYRTKKAFHDYLDMVPTLRHAFTVKDIKEAAGNFIYSNLHTQRERKVWTEKSDDEIFGVMCHILDSPTTMECYDPDDVVPLNWPLLLEDPEIGEKSRRIVATHPLFQHWWYWKFLDRVDHWVLLWPYLSTGEQNRIHTMLEACMSRIFRTTGTDLNKLYRALQLSGVAQPTIFDMFDGKLVDAFDIPAYNWRAPATIPLLDHYYQAGTLDLAWIEKNTTDARQKMYSQDLRDSLTCCFEDGPTQKLERFQQWFKDHPFPGSTFMEEALHDILAKHHQPRQHTREEALIHMIEEARK